MTTADSGGAGTRDYRDKRAAGAAGYAGFADRAGGEPNAAALVAPLAPIQRFQLGGVSSSGCSGRVSTSVSSGRGVDVDDPRSELPCALAA